jgi:arylsulfatase A-like enzyme
VIGGRALDFVRANANRRFFLYWATNLPHIHNEIARTSPDGGYETPTLGPYADKPWPLPKKSYAAQVHRLDQDVGAIRALIDSLGITRKTMIVFLSDNGATFLRIANDGSSDIAGKWFNGTLGYRGFKGDLYEGGLRVPGIVHWPGVVKPGSEYAGRVDFADLHATLTQVAGIAPPPEIDGRSFAPILGVGASFSLRPYQVWYSPDRRQSAVLQGPWKAVWMRDTMRVFNLERDPGELTDLRSAEPVVAARLDSIRRVEDRRVQHPVKPR